MGSRSLSRISGLELSPATIRNVMADLEEMGFVASPHTSAGRVPTPRGYRLFVDSLLTVIPLEQQQTQIMQDQLQIGDPARAMQSAAATVVEPVSFRRRRADTRAGLRASSRSSLCACPSVACC